MFYVLRWVLPAKKNQLDLIRSFVTVQYVIAFNAMSTIKEADKKRQKSGHDGTLFLGFHLKEKKLDCWRYTSHLTAYVRVLIVFTVDLSRAAFIAQLSGQ